MWESPFSRIVIPRCMEYGVSRCPRILGLTANEKDFSLSLEMTIRGKEVFSYTALLHDR